MLTPSTTTTTQPSRRLRRGLTMAELLITLVMLGFIGAALTRMLVQQGRTFSSQQAKREARLVSRNSLGIMLSELRMVQDSAGIDSVGTNGSAVRVEVPYAFGISCGNVAAGTIVQMAPIDSLAQATATPSGYRWRDASNGRWKTTAGTFASTTADALQVAVCGAAGILPDTIQGRPGQTLLLTPAAINGATPLAAGTPIFIYQKVAYYFGASSAYRQGNGLYRRVNGVNQELLGPFDTTSRFRYYIPGSDNATSTAPVDLGTIRGLELVLNGLSERNAPNPSTGRVENIVSRVTTGVLFKNTRQF